jgi:putative ABC transport system substrate-binding protein
LKARRSLLGAAVAALVAGGVRALPPAGRRCRVGLLGAESEKVAYADLEHLRRELRALGYAEGPLLAFDVRWAGSDYGRLVALAKDLAASGVDVLVASGSKAGIAAKEATSTVPVVVSNMGDALQAGFAGSLARPGGNVTGFSAMNPEVTAKQLALLREIKPGLARAGLLMNPANPNFALTVDAMRRAGDAIGVRVVTFEAASAAAIAPAIRAVAAAGIDALVVQSETLFSAQAAAIAKLAVASRVAVAGLTSYADAGALVGYSAPIAERWRHVAGYVDRILNGAAPSSLPIAQPSRVELVLNLVTARAIGVTIPQSLEQRADRVIR